MATYEKGTWLQLEKAWAFNTTTNILLLNLGRGYISSYFIIVRLCICFYTLCLFYNKKGKILIQGVFIIKVFVVSVPARLLRETKVALTFTNEMIS